MSNKLTKETKRARKAARRVAYQTRDARREAARRETEEIRERVEREQMESLGIWEGLDEDTRWWFEKTAEQETSNVQKGLDELTFLADLLMGSGRDTLSQQQLHRLAQLAEQESHRCTLLGDGNMAEYFESIRQIAAPVGARMTFTVTQW